MEKYTDTYKSNIGGCHIAGKGATTISREYNIPRRTVRNWIELFKKGEIAHLHHWILPPPNGPFSVATCKYCKEKDVMRNSTDELTAWTLKKAKEDADDEMKKLLDNAKRLLIKK